MIQIYFINKYSRLLFEKIIYSLTRLINHYEENIKNHIWRPPSVSELNPMVFNTGLTYLGSETSIYSISF